jgi:hypothetical protein
MPEVDEAALDATLRLATGTRGYLDFQDALNRRVRAQFAQILQPAAAAGHDLQLLVASALEAGKFATASELKVRETEKLATIGRADRDRAFSGQAVRFNSQAMRSARRASGHARNARRRLGEGRMGELGEAHQRDGIDTAFEEARESLTTHLVKFNIPPGDFEEVHKIWEEAESAARRGGVEGVLAHIEENLERFTSLRGEEDRGTRPHSPLPWWKYVLIAVILAAAVFAVVACFIWFGCSWVWAALGLVAPWVFGIIDRGC